MAYKLDPDFKKNFPEGFFDILFSFPNGLGYELYHEVFNKKGMHILIIGDSRSGKTEKGKMVDWILSHWGETLIIFDTGKRGDIECYFWNDKPVWRFNKPVNVLIPYDGGCKFEVTGVPEEVPVRVISIMRPEDYLKNIRKGEINIISLRNYFKDEHKLKKYMRKIFENFALNARNGYYDAWKPATMKIDEGHEAAGGQSVASDADSMALTAEVSNMQRQLASEMIRLELISQLYYDFPPAIRKNAHVKFIGRGAAAQKSDDPKIHYLERFALTAQKDQGWVIIHGEHYPKLCPLEFPFIGSPSGVTIIRSGFADDPIDDETPELIGVNRAAALSFTIPEEPPQKFKDYASRWDVDGEGVIENG